MPSTTLDLLKGAWTASAGTLTPAYLQRVFPDRLTQMQGEYRLIRAGLLFPETEDGLAPFQRKWNPLMRYVSR
jgi:hypothetical protein